MSEPLEPRKEQFRHLLRLMQDCEDMLCFGRAANITHYAMQCAPLPGEFVELGCYQGRTAAMITAVSGRKMHLYDSFEGLPQPDWHDKGLKAEHYFEGAMKSDPAFVANWFKSLMLPDPEIKKCWFSEIPPNEFPSKIAFAHIDGDLYYSTMEALGLVHDRVVMGGVIIIDDYADPDLPGVKVAVDEFVSKVKHLRFKRLMAIGGPSKQAILKRWGS